MKIVVLNLLLSFCQTSDTIPKLTKENVYIVITKHCDSPDWVWRQAMMETGHLKSKLCLDHNNLFGMHYPKKRKTLAVGKDPKNRAYYKNWVDSVIDYAMWQKFSPRDDNTNYVDYLIKRHYCEANSDYIKILKNIKIRF